MTIWKGTILSAFGTLAIYSFLPYDSQLVEYWYSNTLFKFVRFVSDYSTGNLPFPTVYLLLIGLVLGLVTYISRIRSQNRNGNKYQILTIKVFSDVFLFLSILVIAFYWLWAFNYKRVSFEKKIGFAKQEISEDWLFQEVENVGQRLISLRSKLDTSYATTDLEDMCRSSLRQVLEQTGYQPYGDVRVRKLKPFGSLLVWSTAGVYLPFVSEGHIDGGLHPITQAFTLTHEMAHGYGIAEESTCNFVAFLACINSINPEIEYSGWMGYFRYLLSASRRTNSERYTELVQSLDREIKQDLQDIYERLLQYPDIMPMIRDRIYNTYLKSHGIKEGTVNYSQMIHLAKSWKTHKVSYLLDIAE